MLSSNTQKELDKFTSDLISNFSSPELITGCEVLGITDKDEYALNNGWIEALCGKHNNQRCRWTGQLPDIQVADYVDVIFYPSYKLFVVFGQGGGGASKNNNYLLVDGSRDSTGEQDFTAGIKTDDIAESTAAAGVTVDGVKLKDLDVYPKSDTAGLYQRLVNNWIGYGNHLTTMPSLTWASYTGFSTPTAAISAPSLMSVYHTAASRHFGYLGSYTGSMRARLSPARFNVIATGIRIDDASQNNYIQLYAETQTSGLVIYKYRQANGGVEAAAVSLFSGQAFLPQFVNVSIAISGTVAFMFLGLDTVLSGLVAVAVFTSWTPIREGFYHEQSAAGSDIQSASWFDACQ